MEIEPGIHQLTHGDRPIPIIPPPNAFLVVGADASVLIDSGYDSEEDHQARLAYLRRIGAPPLSEVLLTHRHGDHAGGALRLHKATGAPLTAHSLEREPIERERLQGEATLGRTVEGGELRDLGGITLQVLHAPGHTMGCLAVFAPERRALFSSDTVLGVSTSAVRPGEGDIAKYVETLAMLLTLEARVVYPGHGGPIADPDARIRELIAHRHHREEQVLAELRSGPRTVAQLREAIYAKLEPGRHRLAEGQLKSQLLKLVNEGHVRADGEDYCLT